MQSRPVRHGFAAAALLALLIAAASAQTPNQIAITSSTQPQALPFDRGALAVWQSLLKLRTRASLLMITAHPDDEDGGMMTYESRGHGARVALLTLNRGEGGQNVMSPDYWDALGLVRTQELLLADRYIGAQQYWTRVADFGFSKSKEESLHKWGHDRVLRDVVRVVRMNRPLVITSVFNGNLTDGHGQHQVAGEVAQEVFKAACDPSVFPDQIKAGLQPWCAAKVYARVPTFSISAKGMYDYATGRWAPVRFYDYVAQRWTNEVPEKNLEIDEGQYSPWLGMTYAQIAREGWGLQKSQNGGGGIPPAGSFRVSYHRYGSRVSAPEKESSFFDGVDTSLVGIAALAKDDPGFVKQGLEQINGLVDKASSEFVAQQPEKIAPTLAAGLKAVNTLIEKVQSSQLSEQSRYNVLHELRIKQAQFNDAIAEALGISVLATVAPAHEATGFFARFMGPQESFQVAIPGQRFGVNVHLVNQSQEPLQLAKIELKPSREKAWAVTPEGGTSGELGSGGERNVRFEVTVPGNAAPTRPYFKRPGLEQPYYDIVDPEYLNGSLPPYPLDAWVEINYQGVPVRVGQAVQAVKRVTGLGTVLDPLVVAPAISVMISPAAGIVPIGEKSFPLAVVVHSNVKGPAKGTLRLDLPQGWKAAPEVAPFATGKDGEDEAVNFTVEPSTLEQKPYTVIAVAEYNGRQYRVGYRTVGYAGLRPTELYRSAIYRATGVDVKTARNLNVAYIMGTGDDVPQSLENLGVQVHLLGPPEVANADLRRFDAIVLGVRTYAARPELRAYNNRLLAYVHNGGVVIVQYNTPQYDHNYGPYPYTLSGDPEKVVDETSQVRILAPANPVFNWPNKITTSDFQGWVEERGHDFMRSWDPRWEALLETHDPGQDPQKGGFLYARYGKGVYIYVAYALYRQLPEGVPGAYRLFANMLSLAKNPELGGAEGK
jgi:LmbE family N-acetylglucosaminyl deacetylase